MQLAIALECAVARFPRTHKHALRAELRPGAQALLTAMMRAERAVLFVAQQRAVTETLQRRWQLPRNQVVRAVVRALAQQVRGLDKLCPVHDRLVQVGTGWRVAAASALDDTTQPRVRFRTMGLTDNHTRNCALRWEVEGTRYGVVKKIGFQNGGRHLRALTARSFPQKLALSEMLPCA